jgi:prepilin-type processing-associated H-X9-DG protein
MARERDEREEDELDDKPKKRSRDEDDDRDEPRRPKKSGMGAGLIIGIALGVMFLISIPCIAVMIGLLLPAVQKVREAAVRSKDQNNMKQIALAAHSFHDVNNQFAGPFLVDQGQVNRGMSWRASMLPYIEQDNVYRMLDKKAAWDSGANRAATNIPISVFNSPYDAPGSTVNTPYKAFVGGGAIFDDAPNARQTKMTDILDGTSNTILFVHAFDQVPWASPQDIKYGANIPLPKFGHANGPKGGYNACFADGSVRFMASTTNEATLRAMISKADGN